MIDGSGWSVVLVDTPDLAAATLRSWLYLCESEGTDVRTLEHGADDLSQYEPTQQVAKSGWCYTIPSITRF